MGQAILHTERLTLVPLADEHLELEIELDSDPEVMRYLSGRARTRAETEAAHRRRLAAAGEGLGFWAADVHPGVRFRRRRRRPIPGADQGEVEYELTRASWQERLLSRA